jgi:hypothetical protein
MVVARSPEHASWAMLVAAHRAPRPRYRKHDGDRALIVANDPTVRRWIEHELFGESVSTIIVEALGDVVTILTRVAPPWQQYLIVDLVEVGPADVALLAALRDAGWPCVVIAIGDASSGAYESLALDVVLPRTLGSEVLRNTIKQIGRDRRSARRETSPGVVP